MNAKQESEKLMNSVLPVADMLLKKFGGFQPFGGYMKPNGGIIDVGVKDPNTEHPKSEDMIDALRSSFQSKHEPSNARLLLLLLM